MGKVNLSKHSTGHIYPRANITQPLHVRGPSRQAGDRWAAEYARRNTYHPAAFVPPLFIPRVPPAIISHKCTGTRTMCAAQTPQTIVFCADDVGFKHHDLLPKQQAEVTYLSSPPPPPSATENLNYLKNGTQKQKPTINAIRNHGRDTL